jgi:prepilin-type N-terminal cleavage/methylation domain-containing protein
MKEAEGRSQKTEVRRQKSKIFNSKLKTQNSKLHSRGFTLIELIIVIILAGILVAAVAVKISMSPSDTAKITAVDQAVSYIQYAQMRAMANRGTAAAATVSIAFTGSTDVYLCNNITPCNNVNKFEKLELPAGTSVGTQTFTFNTLGELLLGTGCINASPSYCRLSLGGTTITGYCITGKISVP